MNNLIATTDPGKQFITLEGGITPLTPDIINSSILELEAAMGALPAESKVGLETMHTFMPGIYVRTVMMKAGSLITGKIHAKEHILIVSKGSAAIVSAAHGAQELVAPRIFVSPGNDKRLLFIREDMIFSTIHPNPTNTQDLAVLEAELMTNDFNEVNT